MDSYRLLLNHDELVKEVVLFFGSKAISTDLYEDIKKECKKSPYSTDKKNHGTALDLGFFSPNDFAYYSFSKRKKLKSIPDTIVGIILNSLCKCNLIFQQDFVVKLSDSKTYVLNYNLFKFLWDRSIIFNLIYGFQFITDNYRNSVFKIVITNENNEAGIGSGFLLNYTNSNIKENSLVITNKHVAKYKENLKVINKNDDIIEHSSIILSSKADLAVIELQETYNYQSFHLLELHNILDDIIVVGYPQIPCSNNSYQVVHKGEINSFIEDYFGNELFLFSAKVSPGNSGGPIINKFGMVVGIVTYNLFNENDMNKKGILPYNAGIPARTIIKFLHNEVFNNIK